MKSPSWYQSCDAPQMIHSKDKNHKGQANKKRFTFHCPFQKELMGQWQWEGLMQYSSLFDIFAMANSGKLCQEKTPVSWSHTLATTKIRETFLVDFSRAVLQDCYRMLLLLWPLWSPYATKGDMVSKQRYLSYPGRLFLVTVLVHGI